MLKNLDKFSLPKIEEQVLNFWKTNKIFKKAEKKNEGKKEFIFYEGPPTANGRPGIHHVLSRSFKDIVLRYKTMSGFKVFRRGGWDTHGLPVELEVEKKLGLKSKKDIEKLGIAKFNKHCKESVWTYKDEWERLTERMGYWLDLENPYITYKNSYIETLWWIVSQAEKKGLLYKAYKVLPWCTRCGTALSSHELAQGYKEVSDPSVYIKFHLKSKQKVDSVSLGSNAYMLSWTTTPWTLPGNVALAVGKKIDYKIATVEKIDGKLDLLQMNENERYVFSTGESKLDIFGDTLNYFENDFSRADAWIKNNDGSKVHVLFKDIKTVKGKDLVGLSYEPIFDLD
ncbi:MAG: class I tRNA ligase family protein, partial [Candidatus Paceibacterota bacterium]